MPKIFGEFTYSEIAEELGVSRSRVQQIEAMALAKCLRRMRQLGYTPSYFNERPRDFLELPSYTEASANTQTDDPL
ncbi:hypothetical protein N9L12_08195 [Luminiphilus sp.]|nr:hypothetical protein [Luminiphilus sp.]